MPRSKFWAPRLAVAVAGLWALLSLLIVVVVVVAAEKEDASYFVRIDELVACHLDQPAKTSWQPRDPAYNVEKFKKLNVTKKPLFFQRSGSGYFDICALHTEVFGVADTREDERAKTRTAAAARWKVLPPVEPTKNLLLPPTFASDTKRCQIRQTYFDEMGTAELLEDGGEVSPCPLSRLAGIRESPVSGNSRRRRTLNDDTMTRMSAPPDLSAEVTYRKKPATTSKRAPAAKSRRPAPGRSKHGRGYYSEAVAGNTYAAELMFSVTPDSGPAPAMEDFLI